MGVVTSKLANVFPSEAEVNLFISGLVRKSKTVQIHWDQQSPSSPDQKCLLTMPLGKDWDYDSLFEGFYQEILAGLLRFTPEGRCERHSPNEQRLYAPGREMPEALVYADKDKNRLEVRPTSSAFKACYRFHFEPLKLEVWAEWLHTPGYHHPAILLEKTHFVNLLLQGMDDSFSPGCVGVHEVPSPTNLWTSAFVSDPLDAYGDFDTIWDHVIHTIQSPQMSLHPIKIQNVTADGFTVFTKGSGGRSSWSWVRYKYDKHKVEGTGAGGGRFGPSVHQTSIGEVVGEVHGPWRDLHWRTYIVLHRKPLQLEFRGESIDKGGHRTVEPLPVIYHGLLDAFNHLYDKKFPIVDKGMVNCCKRRQPVKDTNKDE